MPRNVEIDVTRESRLFRLLTFDLHSSSRLRNSRARVVHKYKKKYNATQEDIKLSIFIYLCIYHCAYFIQKKKTRKIVIKWLLHKRACVICKYKDAFPITNGIINGF